MPKWIDVKDRLPDTTDTVIVRMKIDLLDNDQKLLATMPENIRREVYVPWMDFLPPRS